jgi:hypothetical protein
MIGIPRDPAMAFRPLLLGGAVGGLIKKVDIVPPRRGRKLTVIHVNFG